MKKKTRRTSRGCDIPGCPNQHNAHGLCGTHFQRRQRKGDPLAPYTTLQFTAREDELLLSLPTVGRANRVAPGRMQELSIALGRHKGVLCNRRRLLLSRA